jgi:hypothetical protein
MEQKLTRKPLGGSRVLDDRSRADFVIKFVSAVFGIGLIGCGLWGVWASADFARHVADNYVRSSDDQLSGVTFALVWLVIFAPCLAGEIAILWRTFTPEDNAWLAPLRTFNFILAFKILRETRRRDPRDEPCIEILPPGGAQKLLPPPAGAVHREKDS